jgi:hypothetical protein
MFHMDYRRFSLMKLLSDMYLFDSTVSVAMLCRQHLRVEMSAKTQ